MAIGQEAIVGAALSRRNPLRPPVPPIAQIHGLEKSDSTIALVMELVEGPTLADRIAQGAIPIDEALPIAKQIGEALEAARTGHNNDQGGRR
jgi:serine/threonine protein kinase